MVKIKSALLLATACLLLSSIATAEARKLSQLSSDCDDCSCARVECAKYCESANKIDSFTCDEVRT